MSDTKDTILLAEIINQLKEIKEVVKDAVQIGETKKVDVQKQAESSEEVE